MDETSLGGGGGGGGGQKETIIGLVLGETTRILDGKIVTCFTHYKHVRQMLELIKEAFRKP